MECLRIQALTSKNMGRRFLPFEMPQRTWRNGGRKLLLNEPVSLRESVANCLIYLVWIDWHSNCNGAWFSFNKQSIEIRKIKNKKTRVKDSPVHQRALSWGMSGAGWKLFLRSGQEFVLVWRGKKCSSPSRKAPFLFQYGKTLSLEFFFSVFR